MAGSKSATRMPMMAMTTNNSTSVKPPVRRNRMATLLKKDLTSAAESEEG
jgi:hypothetical protein